MLVSLKSLFNSLLDTATIPYLSKIDMRYLMTCHILSYGFRYRLLKSTSGCVHPIWSAWIRHISHFVNVWFHHNLSSCIIHIVILAFSTHAAQVYKWLCSPNLISLNKTLSHFVNVWFHHNLSSCIIHIVILAFSTQAAQVYKWLCSPDLISLKKTYPLMNDINVESSTIRVRYLNGCHAHWADDRSKWHNIFKKFEIIKFQFYIWNHHGKCIKISTNMPCIGSLFLEILRSKKSFAKITRSD